MTKPLTALAVVLRIGLGGQETHFDAEILTKEDSVVARLGIDKNTGWFRPLY